jgi:ATP-dependent DNA helicase RecG
VFNRPYLAHILNYADVFTLVGNYYQEGNYINLLNIRKNIIPENERYKPVYRLPSSLHQGQFSALMKRSLTHIKGNVKSILPNYLIEKYRLLPHLEALEKVHFPQNASDVALGLRSLKFEECLDYCLKNKIINLQNKEKISGQRNQISLDKINDFVRNMPYKLTKDQLVALREIILDMNGPSLMYRLLQGDVGTGKTIVALIALYANFLRKKQGVLLSPTDSLARQHYENAKKIFQNYDIKIELLVGSLSIKEKKDLQEKILNHQCDIIIGTHAVFSKKLAYNSLGLAIIDEQHRFGVNQRNALVQKGDQVDLLMMSATPIPRTLSLSLYGDLDVSSLYLFPSGKRDVKTVVVDYSSSKIEGLINYCLSLNQQVFMICPKIEKNKKSKNKSIDEIYKKYYKIYHDEILVLHGELSEEEKIAAITKFKNKEAKILLATSIVELGIDIHDAMGIIIFSANSFGLASLHQLRGRVGRNGQKSYCLLVDTPQDDDNLERLKFLEKCDDGYQISEEDLRLRGPGDFDGIDQSGFPHFNTLNIVSDFKMFEVARDETKYILNNLQDDENLNYYNQIKTKMNQEDLLDNLVE